MSIPPTNPFFKIEAEVAEAKAKALGYDTKILIHNDDVATQSDLFDEAINGKAAAIICDNASSNATVIPIKKAREANIPTFLIDREITEKDLAISQIVADNYQGAKGVAEAFVEAMGESGTYVELLGRETDTNAHIRSAAFHEVIDAYKKFGFRHDNRQDDIICWRVQRGQEDRNFSDADRN